MPRSAADPNAKWIRGGQPGQGHAFVMFDESRARLIRQVKELKPGTPPIDVEAIIGKPDRDDPVVHDMFSRIEGRRFVYFIVQHSAVANDFSPESDVAICLYFKGAIRLDRVTYWGLPEAE